MEFSNCAFAALFISAEHFCERTVNMSSECLRSITRETIYTNYYLFYNNSRLTSVRCGEINTF